MIDPDLLKLNLPENKGFTLIEMLAVTLVIGIIAAIVAPNLFALMNQNIVRQGLTQLEGAIREGQKQAAREGESCTITIDAVNNQITNVAGNNCLLSNRVLDDDLIIATNVNNNGTPDQFDITFSSKGNVVGLTVATPPPLNEAMFIVHMANGTDAQRCLVISGVLGNMRNGTYDSDPAVAPDQLVLADCN